MARDAEIRSHEVSFLVGALVLVLPQDGEIVLRDDAVRPNATVDPNEGVRELMLRLGVISSKRNIRLTGKALAFLLREFLVRNNPVHFREDGVRNALPDAQIVEAAASIVGRSPALSGYSQRDEHKQDIEPEGHW